ncbi:MAG: hypothetical protein H0T79_05835 [Deltaproteobacteria bacterium]|nr:hypothetical protein [Deltaproteobacteria bacterium]
MLTESAGRWLLVLHTALGVAAVGAATHLVVWLRPYLRGKFNRHAAVRKFAWIALTLHATGFLVGNVMYPTYRVEVRAAYFETTTAVTADLASRQAELAKVARKEGADVPDRGAPQELARQAGKATRWFDVKEHWVVLGLFGSAALVLMLAFWDPRRDGAALVPIVFGLAAIVAGTLWFAAIVGVMTSAWRAI